ncbi:hypothetical protein GYMLUDRAFT_34668 [Collybiopsis luxurians FD-317 M1]|nr:hypothetical protein GYMLUDRAFT_34668 [Collybiopsis luxurians FD-317 M1]
MQRPTLESVRIRSTRDALQVFYGVATNKLALITRRLDAEERRAIKPGDVYVWEERGANTETIGIGMERWTDGMGWGPSRVRDEFLFYHQKESDIEDDPLTPITPWAQLLRRDPRIPNSSRSVENERLVKQTYSVQVYLPADRARGIVRKWHLTAYFSQEKLSRLRMIDSVQGIGNVAVPEGLFRSARANKARRDPRELSLPATSSVPETANRPYPSPRGGQFESGAISVATSALPSSPRSLSRTSSPHSPSFSEQLVPLQYLQSSIAPRRDPVDEQLLRRFTATNSRPFN